MAGFDGRTFHRACDTYPVTTASAYRKQPATWSSTSPTLCMNAYTIVEPTNRKPRRRRSAESASETGVVAGMEPAAASGRQARRRRRHDRREIGRRTTRTRAAVVEERAGVADRRVDLGAVADDPGVGHQPRPVVVVEGRDDRRVEAAERRAERLALAQDRRPREPRLERLEGEPLEQLDVVVTGVPHSSSWYATISGSGFGPPAPDHQQRGRSSACPSSDSRYGIGVVSKSVLRIIGSAAGRRGVEDRPEDVARDRLRARRPDERHADEPAGDAALGEVQRDWSVADVRPRIRREPGRQLRPRVRVCMDHVAYGAASS